MTTKDAYPKTKTKPPFMPIVRRFHETPSACTHLRPEGFRTVEEERVFYFETTSLRIFECPDGVARSVSALNWFWEALEGPIASHFEASTEDMVALAWTYAVEGGADEGVPFDDALRFVTWELMREYREEALGFVEPS